MIGSPTAFACKRESFDLPAVARELGVRYVLQGRIERGEAEVETNVRLSGAATGAVIWSDTIAVAKEGVINLRREVIARLAMALGLQLATAEAKHSAAHGTAHPEAIDLGDAGTDTAGRCLVARGLRNQFAALWAGPRHRTRFRHGAGWPCPCVVDDRCGVAGDGSPSSA